ncbi:MAG: hypothetical protein QM627_07990 [Luteolibacter sp.]
MNRLLLLVKLISLLSLFGLNSCASRFIGLPYQTPAQARKELATRVSRSPQLAVLFVGNSYSFGIPKEFTRIAEERGKSVRTGHSTYGSWTLSKHAQNPPTLKKIREGNWDIIVFQEQSLIPSYSRPRRNFLMLPPLAKLVLEARKAGAIPVLYQTWGRKDGNVLIHDDDFFAMTRRLRVGYAAASAALGNIVVVPAGDSWEKEALAGRKDALYLMDGSHPSPTGNEVTAETFFRTFYGS